METWSSLGLQGMGVEVGGWWGPAPLFKQILCKRGSWSGVLDEKAGNAVGRVQRLFPNTLHYSLRLWGEARKVTKFAKPSPARSPVPNRGTVAGLGCGCNQVLEKSYTEVRGAG